MNDGSEVLLAIYDLSHGMAKQLSAQFLGPGHELEMIPHTAIRCFRKEWYFGGGIQSVDPIQFQFSTGMVPVQVLPLGRTTMGLVEFESWCVQQQQYPHGKFTVASYDLLHCNCNHFSHAAALQGLKLSQGVPQWILDVPQRFLSSPMGQLVRPMLEQMQITAQSPVAPISASSCASTRSGRCNPKDGLFVLSDSVTTEQENPWTASTSQAAHPSESMSTPVLDSFHKPLVSKDTGSIPLIIRKITSSIQGNDSNEDEEDSQKKLSILGNFLQKTLSTAGAISPIATALEEFQSEEERIESALKILWNLVVAHDGISSTPSNLTFALMLLRLVVLVVPTSETMIPSTLSSSSVPVYSSTLQDILAWMQRQLIMASDDDDGDSNIEDGGKNALLDRNPAARSMAWCVLSNMVSAIINTYSIIENIPTSDMDQYVLLVDNHELIDSAIRDMTASNCQVRQAATCFLYNLALCHTRRILSVQDTLSQTKQEEEEGDDNDGILLQDDLLLSILCAVVEEFSLIQLLTTKTTTDSNSKGGIQYDPTTCLRRLAVVGRILVPLSSDTTRRQRCNGAVRRFLLDLGLDQFLKDHVATATTRGNTSSTDLKMKEDAEQCRQLATELYKLLESSTHL